MKTILYDCGQTCQPSHMPLAAEEAKVLIKVELNELFSSSFSSSSQAAFQLFLENVDCWLTYFAACHKTLHTALHIIEIERE